MSTDSAARTDTPQTLIRPGTLPLDDRGKPAQLHAAGIQRVGSRWYAWGEEKSGGGLFTSVAVYTSTDLVNWHFEGDALTAGSGELGPDRVVERPKALQRSDGRWVLFLHLDTADYGYARVGYALADTPEGPFELVSSERPLGHLSRDIGVYQEDGVGYLLSEDRDNGTHIYRLRPDYLGVEAEIVTVRQQDRPELGYESPTVVKHEGIYYLFGSDLTGWNTNDNKYSVATALEGPWTPWRDIAPVGTHTFDSQVSVVVPLGGDHFLFAADRWRKADLFNSPLVWLPLTLHDGHAELEWRDEWSPLDEAAAR
ncbi:Glycosyl hydrolases family 43 [Propionibacterium cyclohexanicum]|uniref:Glycosyl hydrolases family 43 n=1 Tax=Propionibacterium cyclohexanicum TaxID=64702 RepID=A0A1H9U1P2_9ACTN|nr:family 43 glycosylhydrolase [Propionibacterium cyclohexanicum]SES03520.1 Glycosyl hydrolases family 43 [Propionibacterium cyclohexanicum]